VHRWREGGLSEYISNPRGRKIKLRRLKNEEKIN